MGEMQKGRFESPSKRTWAFRGSGFESTVDREMFAVKIFSPLAQVAKI